MNRKSLNNSIEELENVYWGQAPTDATGLVKKCHGLRKVPLKELDNQDVRVLISQNIGLKYLVPIALNTLKDDLFIEVEFFEGDLLKSVLKVHKDFWLAEPKYMDSVIDIFNSNFDKKNEIEFYDEKIISSLVEMFNSILELKKNITRN